MTTPSTTTTTTPTTTTPTNSDTDNSSGGFFGNDKVGGFAYGIGVSAGILLLITTITLASYFCTRDTNLDGSSDDPESGPHHHHNRRRRNRQPSQGGECVIEVLGVDEATLKTFPKLLYSQLATNIKNNNKVSSTSVSCCSICLADYKANDVVRLLPDCGHVFHLKCVDPWLRLHPTCPVCRTSPLPTPQSTPLAEVVPASITTTTTTTSTVASSSIPF